MLTVRRLQPLAHMKLPSSRILAGIGIPLFPFGVAIAPVWEFVGGSGLATTEFPLGHPVNAAVDSKDRIFVAENFHHRVQRYSSNGNFEMGWFVPTSGAFALRTISDDRVQIATARANKLLTYSCDLLMVADVLPLGGIRGSYTAGNTDNFLQSGSCISKRSIDSRTALSASINFRLWSVSSS